MRRPLFALESRLLRKSVARLAETRDECADCGRVPLVGERVHLYADDSMVCALCRPLHREEPVRSELMLHSEHGHAVKPHERIAVAPSSRFRVAA